MKRGLPAWAAVLLALLAIAGIASVYHFQGQNQGGNSPITLLVERSTNTGGWQDLSMLDLDHNDVDFSLDGTETELEEIPRGTKPALLGRPHTSMLYQIGDQEFLSPTAGGVEDMAMEVERALAKEQVELKKIDREAEKHQRVEINVIAGQIGKRGPPGPKGYEGPRGFAGERGPRGVQGRMGPQGIKGIVGIKGVKGLDGEQGPTGDRGVKGATGPQGPAGRDGREGPRGDEGAVGANGKPGRPGTMGIMGPPGPPATGAGTSGPPGPPGPPGPAGIPGNDGMPGAEGPQGDKGQNGSPGHEGLKGVEGIPGKSSCGLASTLGKRVCCGDVSSSAFRDLDYNTVYVDVDTRKCNYRGNPKYFVSMYGNSYVYQVWTENDITSSDVAANHPGKSTFRVYMQRPDYTPSSYTRSWAWGIKWCAVGDSTDPPLEYFGMCCGSQTAGWSTYPQANGVQIRVDTSGCGWTETAAGQTSFNGETMAKAPPAYFVDISDNTCNPQVFTSETSRCVASTSGGSAIYAASRTGFNLYLQPLPGKQYLNLDRVNQNGWRVNWCAFDPTHPPRQAGFPCTAPRLLAGASSPTPQSVATDFGSICCGTTKSSDWKDGGAGFLKQEVDMSYCNFKYPPTTVLTNIVGKQGTTRKVGGAASYTVTDDVNKILVYAWTGAQQGTFPAFRATDDDWKVEWCAMGRV